MSRRTGRGDTMGAVCTDNIGLADLTGFLFIRSGATSSDGECLIRATGGMGVGGSGRCGLFRGVDESDNRSILSSLTSSILATFRQY